MVPLWVLYVGVQGTFLHWTCACMCARDEENRREVNELQAQVEKLSARVSSLYEDIRMEGDKIRDARNRANIYEEIWKIEGMNPETRLSYLRSKPRAQAQEDQR